MSHEIEETSWFLNQDYPADVVLSPDGTKVYVASDDGFVHAFDLVTGQLLDTWAVGNDLGGMDVSQDGSFLIVVEEEIISSVIIEGYQYTTVTTYRIDTQTGAVTDFPLVHSYPDAPFFDVVVLANGDALFSQEGWGHQPVWTLDVDTGSYTATTSTYFDGGDLSRDSDGTTVIFSPQGFLYRYELGSGFIDDTYRAAGSIYGQDTISPDGSRIALFYYPEGIWIRDFDLSEPILLTEYLPGTYSSDEWHETVYNVLPQNYHIRDTVFSPSGSSLFILDDETDTIIELSTTDWSLKATFAVGADVGTVWVPGVGNRLLITSDGNFMVSTTSGIRVVTQAARIDEFVGTADSDRLTAGDTADNMFGNSGDDRLSGGAGADFLDGGVGFDILDGGQGNDILIGGADADVYLVDSAGNQFLEEANGGEYDWVRVSAGVGATLQQKIANQYSQPLYVEVMLGTANGQGLRGNMLNNNIFTGDGADFINAQDGGTDYIESGGGRDVIYYGAALDSSDANHGGDEGGDVRGDLLVMQGDYALTLGTDGLIDIEKLRVLKASNTSFGYEGGGSFDYDITTVDANVAAGGRLVVQGGSLQVGETLHFDGLAETDGSFQIFGGRDADVLIGGAGDDHLLGRAGDDMLTGNDGNDRLRGGLGADVMSGGVGADTFVYAAQGGAEPYAVAALESTSLNYDTIVGFNFFGEDKIDLPQAVSSLAAVGAGVLNDANFDADLAAAVDAALAVNGAVRFTADSGDHAGDMFLVVDADGNGSYQANLDFVIYLQDPANVGSASVNMFV